MMKQQKKKLKGITPINLDVCPMRRFEKLFKYSSVRQTDFSLLLDLKNLEPTVVQGCPVYHFEQLEGAYLVKGFLQAHEQLAIAQQALNAFVEQPYRTNLSGQKGLYDNSSHSEQQQPMEEAGQKQEPEPKLQPPMNGQAPYSFDERIRWANLGYNYDWTNRKYPSTKTPMPQSIVALAARANALYNELTHRAKNYSVESAIVNYYKERDAMTSHLDDAEPDQTQPIFSFSLGLSCVFLIGGETKDTEPIALRLDSGDLMVMADRSRRCYHGVPRIIAQTFFKEQFTYGEQKQIPRRNSLQQTQDYLSTHRININIRQVNSPVIEPLLS